MSRSAASNAMSLPLVAEALKQHQRQDVVLVVLSGLASVTTERDGRRAGDGDLDRRSVMIFDDVIRSMASDLSHQLHRSSCVIASRRARRKVRGPCPDEQPAGGSPWSRWMASFTSCLSASTAWCRIVHGLRSSAARLLEPIHLDGPQRRDCVAGHVRLELRNVVANYPFERSHRFAGIQPNSGHRDYSRLSCGVGETQLEPSQDRRRSVVLTPWAACQDPAQLRQLDPQVGSEVLW